MKPIHRIAAVGLGLSMSAQVLAGPDGVLLIGDSWAEQQWDDQAHALVFDALGFGQIPVFGAATTESGTTAADWVQPGRLQTIADELAARPEVGIVQVTLGGNDFLDTWSTALDSDQIAALTAGVRADLQTLTNFVLDQRPDVEILLSFYDYPNFVDTLGGPVGLFFCAPLWNDLGQPSPCSSIARRSRSNRPSHHWPISTRACTTSVTSARCSRCSAFPTAAFRRARSNRRATRRCPARPKHFAWTGPTAFT